MFVLYLPAEDSRDYEILTRPEQISVSGSWHRELGRLSLRPSAAGCASSASTIGGSRPSPNPSRRRPNLSPAKIGLIRLADLIGKAEHHGDSEADLLALMRTDRKVQDRRRAE